MSQPLSSFLLLVVLIIINGIFSMTEMAIVSVRKARLQHEMEKGNRKARTALELYENPNDFFSTIQIFITLVGVITGAVGASAFSGPVANLLAKVPLFSSVANTLALLLVSIVITYFSLVIGELIPKRLAISFPEKISLNMSGIMRALSRITKPLVSFLSWSTEIGIKILGVKKIEDDSVSEDEVKVMIEQGTLSGVFDETEQDIVESVFRMSDKTVDGMMTPRTELCWIDLDEPLEESLAEIKESDDSYFPLVRGTTDNVVGIVSAKKILDAYISGDEIDLSKMAETPLFIPESKPALSVVDDLRESGKQVAIVLDEYGGFSGMVTLLDILEELVGDVPGLYDTYHPEMVEREDGSWLIDGQMDIEEFKDELGIKQLADEDRVGYQTLAGFMLSKFGFIPKAGDSFEADGYRFEIVDMDNRRIDKVMVTKLASPSEDDSDKTDSEE
ncbi:MAG TPA: hemolysin family protein [Flexilinea sp.]|nr:hemolysin family protein [Flexilinea sp.]HOW07360.1 hemolysin family protein [Flexilinea sp.]HPS47377.1 hemolysin family protein [Flexilinea sp.]